MGKYINSEIHNKYSSWHWNLISIDDKYKRLYLVDIDRMWIEYDLKREAVVAVIDIKWDDGENGITATEKGIYEWFEKRGARVYIVYISKDFNRFRVINKRAIERIFTSLEYADWLLNMRNNKYYEGNNFF